MNKECAGCLMSKECELYDYNIESNCPCRECLVKITCRETCSIWIQYIGDNLYNNYKGIYGDHEATCAHVENKVKRFVLLRKMREVVMINPCLFK